MGNIRRKVISIIHYQRRKGASWIEFKVPKSYNLSIEVSPPFPDNIESLSDLWCTKPRRITLTRDNFELPVYDVCIPGLVDSVRESLE